MLSLAATCFALAGVALAKRGVPSRLALAALLVALGLATNLAALGVARGIVTTLVLTMTSAALLVFVLAPRPRASLPLAGVSAGLGVLMLAAHLVRP